jgi:hypothetical protein
MPTSPAAATITGLVHMYRRAAAVLRDPVQREAVIAAAENVIAEYVVPHLDAHGQGHLLPQLAEERRQADALHRLLQDITPNEVASAAEVLAGVIRATDVYVAKVEKAAAA